jgi:hypothetical protein
MPPRRSERLSAAAASAATLLWPLPDDVALRILTLIPADARARCAAVRRAWHAALAQPSLWAHLNLSETSGVTLPVTDTLLRCVAAKARGELQTLDVTGCASLSLDALRGVFTANAASLRTARVSFALAPVADGIGDAPFTTFFEPDNLESLLAAAPALRELHTDVLCAVNEVPALLLAHAPYERVRVTHAQIDDHCRVVRAAASLADMILAALAGGPAVALPDEIDEDVTEETVALVAEALRANNASALTSLSLGMTRGGLAHQPGAAASVLRALEAHASLRKLHVHVSSQCSPLADARARGDEVAAVLSVLLAANAPALSELRVFVRGRVRDDDLRPLCGALPGNSHLRCLELKGLLADDDDADDDDDDDGVSEAFARDVLLPAVQQNASLRELRVGDADAAAQPPSSVQQAAALVAGR